MGIIPKRGFNAVSPLLFAKLRHNLLNLRFKLLFALLFGLCTSVTWAQTRVWTGGTSTDWFTAANWQGGNIPTAGQDVEIRSGTYAPAFNTTLQIGNLTIGNWSGTAPLYINGGTLTVTGSIALNGGGTLQVNGGTLTQTGTSFTFPYNSDVGVNITAGTLSTNATNFDINNSMTMSGGRFNANGGLGISNGKSFTATAGIIHVTGHLHVKPSSSTFTLTATDSLLVDGRITVGTSTNFYAGSTNIVVNRQSGQNNQISGNWYTQQANVVFNPSIPMGANLTSISSSGASFRAGQGTVLFNDSVFIGSNASLNADSGTVTFTRSLQVSDAGTVNNDVGTLNFQGNATFQSSGTLNAGSGALNFGGDVVVDNSNGVINAGEANIVVQGDLTNTGTFNAGTSTVIFDGDSDQVISNDIVFYNLVIETDGALTAGGNVTVLNDGVIGDSTEIILDENQLNVQGELTDNGGNLAVATAKPFVSAASTPTNTQIQLVFNEKLNATSTNTANYSVSPALTVSNAALNDSVVTLTVSAMTASVEYTVTMNNIQNLVANEPVNPNHIKRVNAVFAVAPGTQATALIIDQPDTTTLRVRIARGNGARVLVVARATSAVNAGPVNGTGYSAGSTFGTGTDLGSGNFVVYAGTDTVFTLTGLNPNTIYHFRAAEYNGTGSGSQYNTTGMPVANRTTLYTRPVSQASITSKTSVTTTSLTINFAAGGGNRRLVVLREGTQVNQDPAQGAFYTANAAFGSAGQIGSGNRVVYYSTGTSVAVTGLNPGTQYFIKVYEANGSANGNDHYLLAGAPQDSFYTIAAEPTVTASAAFFLAVDTTSLTLRVTKGNGSRRLVAMRRVSAVTASPVDGQGYTASAVFGAGDTLNAETFVVYDGADSVFTVTGLEVGVIYQYRVVEYNGLNSYANYRTSSVLSTSRTTLDSVPTQQTSPGAIEDLTATTVEINFVPGNGNRRLVLLKAGDPVDADPVNGVIYTANAVFGSGTQLGSGNYVVYAGTGTLVDVTALLPGTSYHYKILEYGYTNAGSENFLQTNAITGSFTTRAVTPTIQASALTVTAYDSNSISIRFNKGNGARHLVLIRQSAAVGFSLVNGISYTGNTVYGTGDSVAAATYAIHAGTDTSLTITGLTPGLTYHFRVNTYNGTADSTAYMTTGAPTISRAVLSTTPTSQVQFTSVSNRTSTAFRINWVAGNGTHRLVVMRKNAPVTFDPQDGITYTSGVYGAGSHLGDSNYVVYYNTGATNSGNLTGLQANSLYYFKVFEVRTGSAGSSNYLLTSAPDTATRTLAVAPVVSASALVVTQVSATSMSLSWVRGDGARSLVVIRQNNTAAAPTSGNLYTASSVFGSGSQTSAGTYVVYADTGNTLTVTGLTANTNYRYAVYTYHGEGISAAFKTTSPPTLSRNTLPAVLSSAPVFDLVTPVSFRLSWTGAATGKLVVIRKGSPVSAYPEQGQNYTANTAFGSGALLGDSNYVVYSATSNSVTISNLEQNSTYYVALFDYSGSAATRSYAFSPAFESDRFTYLFLNISIFLEGPFEGDSMRTNITAELPLNQPYNTAPWNYAGSEAVGSIPAVPIVDWVYIQLRKAGSAAGAVADSVKAEVAGFLRSNGSVVATDGTSFLTMETSAADSFYVVVYHRTHIPVMSATYIHLEGGAYSHDFTTSNSSAYGADPLALLTGGFWGQFAGRIENSTPFAIDLADIIRGWDDRNTVGGYAEADAVLEGLVDASDRTVVWNNRNRSSYVP